MDLKEYLKRPKWCDTYDANDDDDDDDDECDLLLDDDDECDFDIDEDE